MHLVRTYVACKSNRIENVRACNYIAITHNGEQRPRSERAFHVIERIFWKEGNVLFNDALNTFYLRLYGVSTKQIVREETYCRQHGLLFPINSKGYFICTFPQT